MLYIICGTPGSGKTTYAKKIAGDLQAPVFSLDNLVDEYYGDQHGCDLGVREYAVKYETLKKITELLRAERDVILDYGFFKEAERQWYRLLASDYGQDSQVHYVTTAYDTQLQRVLQRNEEPDNIHHIDKTILDELLTFFEIPQDDDLVTIET